MSEPAAAGPAAVSAGAVADVRARATRSAATLVVRFGLVQLTSLFVGVLLSRWLGPAPFGILAIATAVVGVFDVLGDLGLGYALIQKHDELTETERRAVFTIQVLLGLGLGTVVLLLGPTIERLFWKTDVADALIVPLVVATVFVAPYRTITGVLLERDLRFARVTAIEVGEHLASSLTALALAAQGWEVAALGGSVLARSAAGLLLCALLGVWSPRFTTRLSVARPLFSFGIARQTSILVYMLNGVALPFIVGRFCGEHALGLVLWAYGNAERPKALLDIISRVSFPSYARLRADPAVIRAGLERSLHGVLLASGLYGGLLFGTAPVFVRLVYTEKWLAGVPFLEAFLGIYPIVVVTILLDIAFLASGWAGLVRNLHVVRLVLTWGLAVPATWAWGPLGYVIAYAVAMTGFLLAEVVAARSLVPVGALARAVAGPLAAASLSAAAGRGTTHLLAGAHPWLVLLAGLAASGAAFVLAALVLDRARCRETLTLVPWRRP